MENWQKDLVDIIENFADETESFFLEMSDLVGAFFEITTEISEQIYASLTEDLTESFEEFCAQLMEDGVCDYETTTAFSDEIEATSDKNPACVGCSNYHGQAYNGNLLVCAIHPYGYNDVSCPDWENIIQ